MYIDFYTIVYINLRLKKYKTIARVLTMTFHMNVLVVYCVSQMLLI